MTRGLLPRLCWWLSLGALLLSSYSGWPVCAVLSAAALVYFAARLEPGR